MCAVYTHYIKLYKNRINLFKYETFLYLRKHKLVINTDNLKITYFKIY